MATNNLKTSVLKANEELAIRCWIDFKALNEKEDWKSNGVEFRKKDLTENKDGIPLKKGSFEILYTRLVDGVRKGRAVFRFLKKTAEMKFNGMKDSQQYLINQ